MKRDTPSYHGHRFPSEIISHAVWLYHRFDPLVHSPGCARNPWRYTSVLLPAVGNTLFVFALP